jgi:arylsulfatase A-like enzyme
MINNIKLYLLCSISLALAFNGNANKLKTEKVKPSSPNIIFFLADDMRWDAMGCAGNEIVQTPNLDNLANSGIMFNNTFVTTSICAISRASILTGQYASKHGINDFSTSLSSEALSNTYPVLMRNAGFHTGFIGKYGIGQTVGEVEKEFDYFWGTASQPDFENTDDDGNFIHYTDWVEKHIVQFLEEREKNKPFCLSVSFKAPHCQDNDPRQFIYNERYRDLYSDIVIPGVETNTEEVWEKFPDFFKENNEARKRWKIRFSTPEKYQEMVKGYYRLITGVDDVIGNVRDKLKEMGIDDNTILVFTSDNGFYLGEYGMAGKWYGHEPSIRIPLIIYNPEMKDKAGTVNDNMVLNIDFAPTLLSLADIVAPREMQGRDINKILVSKNERKWRNSFYYEHTINQFPTIPVTQGLRTQRYKYLVFNSTLTD